MMRNIHSLISKFIPGSLRKVYYFLKANISYREFSRNGTFEYKVFTSSPNNHLTFLSQKFGSDKGSTLVKNPYPWKPHSYTIFYHHVFAQCRETVKYVFECGIGTSDVNILSNMSATGATGASLRMWREYFPEAHVFGADIDPKAIFQDERISTYQMDQTSQASIADFWSNIEEAKFDLMIDDGLHTFMAGVTLFENSIHKLSRFGIYFIEDVNIYDLVKYQEYFSATKYIVEYVTLYHGNNNISDDCLIKITRE